MPKIDPAIKQAFLARFPDGTSPDLFIWCEAWAAALAPQGWRPIETAPKHIVSEGFASRHGPRFLGYPVNDLVAGVRWSQSHSDSSKGGFVSDWNTSCQPTHWMPLPAPPEASHAS